MERNNIEKTAIINECPAEKVSFSLERNIEWRDPGQDDRYRDQQM